MIQTFNLYGADSNVDSYYLSICQNICDRPIHEVCVFFIPLFQAIYFKTSDQKSYPMHITFRIGTSTTR